MDANELVFGEINPPQLPVKVKAGRLSAEIEPASGFLRYVKIDGLEVVRGIYAAVRDAGWGTVVPTLTGFKVDQKDDGFTCTFAAEHRAGDIKFVWAGSITGSDKGEIVYTFDGQALSEFSTCRTGVCVLHPSSISGQDCVIEHTDGKNEEREFPGSISPHQPFFDVKAITHVVEEDVRVRMEFSGEVFETEDQRNWTDASYKTYCRPLAKGFPYKLAKDEKVKHVVTIRLVGGGDVYVPEPENSDLKTVSIGTYIDEALSDTEIAELKSLGLAHVMAPVEMLEVADKVGLPVLAWTGKAEVPNKLSPDDALLLAGPERSAELASLRGAKRFAASGGNFTELNRNRPVEGLDGVAFAVNAQVHAFDTRSIQESAWTHGQCVMTAKEFTKGKIAVGPVTLMPGKKDPRVETLPSIGYVLASLRTIAEEGGDYATYFSAKHLLASPARLVLDVLNSSELVGSPRGQEPYWVSLKAKFAPEGASQTMFKKLIANQTAEPITVSLEDVLAGSVVQILDASNAADWRKFHRMPAVPTGEKLTLAAYAFAVIHWSKS